jgi:hypothetical protein
VLVGGMEGAQLKAACLESLRGLGYANPHKDVAAYFPELIAEEAPARAS